MAAEKVKPVHPEYLASLVNEAAAGDAILTADTGMCTVWAARYLRKRKGRRLLGSFITGLWPTRCHRRLERNSYTSTGSWWLSAAMADSAC